MKLEEKELHEAPEQWKSTQKDVNTAGKILIPIFLVAGAVSLILAVNESTVNPFACQISAVIFIVIALALLFGILYSNFDQKDNWYMKLPYNKALYRKFAAGVAKMLNERGYDFATDEQLGRLSTVEKDGKTNKPFIGIYNIKFLMKPKLKLKFYLQVIQGKNTTYFEFPIEIHNIRSENLMHAHQLQTELMGVLHSINYEQYKEEH